MMSILGSFIFEMIFSVGLVTIGFAYGSAWETKQRMKDEEKNENITRNP